MICSPKPQNPTVIKHQSNQVYTKIIIKIKIAIIHN